MRKILYHLVHNYLVHEIYEGASHHLGINWFVNSRSWIVLSFIIPGFPWFFDPYCESYFEGYYKGWRLRYFRLYFRIRNLKSFSHSQPSRFVFGLRLGNWVSVGKKTLIATHEELEEGLSQVPYVLKAPYIFRFDGKMRKIKGSANAG